ncbi:MAG: hypothetical protein FDZ70_01670 [Actinobacteria bacterium]|nr:MAG: hypothetical protein FDZ70_01670 [Actinomycetota bacterium]
MEQLIRTVKAMTEDVSYDPREARHAHGGHCANDEHRSDCERLRDVCAVAVRQPHVEHAQQEQRGADERNVEDCDSNRPGPRRKHDHHQRAYELGR